jgi:hypothetical protein
MDTLACIFMPHPVRFECQLNPPNELKTVKIETATVTSVNGGKFPSLLPGTTCLLAHFTFFNFYFETNFSFMRLAELFKGCFHEVYGMNLMTERWSQAVALLVEALCYKPEGRRFKSRRGHWISQLT